MVAIPLLVRRQAGTTGTCSPKFVPSWNGTRGAAGGAGEGRGKGGCQRRRPRRAEAPPGGHWDWSLVAGTPGQSAHNQGFRQEAGIRSLIPIWGLGLPVHCSSSRWCQHWQWPRVLSHAIGGALGATGSGAGSLPRSTPERAWTMPVASDSPGGRTRLPPPAGAGQPEATPAKGQDRWHASAMAIRRARAARDPQRPSRRDTGAMLRLTTGPVALVE
jgi:hypothetical protein